MIHLPPLGPRSITSTVSVDSQSLLAARWVGWRSISLLMSRVSASVSAGAAATSTQVRSCARATPDDAKSAPAAVRPQQRRPGQASAHG